MLTNPDEHKMYKKKIIKSANMQALAQYREQLREHPKLTQLFVELTDTCNMNCRHCGSRCSQANEGFIDTDLLIRTLETVSEDFDPFSVMICFTGGEPLLHPDFLKIVREAVRLGFPWGITTNGMLISEKTGLEMKKLGLQSITISLDGLEEMHDWFRNQRGCFQKTVHVIEMMNRIGIPVQITTVVHKKNIGQLEDLYLFLCGLDIISWRIINMEPIGRAKEVQDLFLTKQEFQQMLDFIRDKRFSRETVMDVCFGCSHYLSFEYEHEVRDFYFLCIAGICVASILCNGDIYSCLDIERRPDWIQGNIGHDRFGDVWRNRFQQFRMNRTELSSLCRECEEKEFCNADSLHTWDFDKEEPMFCYLKDYYGG